MYCVYNLLHLASVEPQVGRTSVLHGWDRIFLDITHVCSLTRRFTICIAGRESWGREAWPHQCWAKEKSKFMSSSICLRLRRRAKLIQAQTLREESSHQSPPHNPPFLLPFLSLSPAVSCFLHVTHLFTFHYIYSFGECSHGMVRNKGFSWGPNSVSLGIWVTTSCLLFFYLYFISTCKMPCFEKLCEYTKAQAQNKRYHQELNHHLNPFTNWFGLLHLTSTGMKDFLMLSLSKTAF